MGRVSIVDNDVSSSNQEQSVKADNEDRESEKLEKLIAVFNSVFSVSENTVLVSGNGEPIYLPANQNCSYHQIIFANNFFSSALHEISHWLVAGRDRRQLEDYGYWYKPDGRTELEQAEFEKVEIKPQALEWLLSEACHHTFHFSADNLNAKSEVSKEFKESVRKQLLLYLEESSENRLATFRKALTATFSCRHLTADNFNKVF